MPQWSDFITVNGSGAPTDNNQSGAAGNGATKMNVTACSSDDAGNTPANTSEAGARRRRRPRYATDSRRFPEPYRPLAYRWRGLRQRALDIPQV